MEHCFMVRVYKDFSLCYALDMIPYLISVYVMFCLIMQKQQQLYDCSLHLRMSLKHIAK